jgi:hypothetical protein
MRARNGFHRVYRYSYSMYKLLSIFCSSAVLDRGEEEGITCYPARYTPIGLPQASPLGPPIYNMSAMHFTQLESD